MSVHYKFKSALDFDTITFDGLHISVSDLKKEIIHHKRLGKVIDYDLQITNAQTKEEYADNATLIPKNTSLIIARVPLAHQPKKGWDPQADKPQIVKPIAKPNPDTLDLSQMNGTEEDKINAMMQQSTMDYDPKGYQKLRGQSQTGEVPPNYRCYKCHKPGHWIKNCPLNALKDSMPEIKRTAGIPRSFIDKDDKTDMTEEDQKAFVAPEQKSEIPEDLICSICKDIFTDAVMIPCCGSSFCDECVRTALLESEDNECPDCKEKSCSPASLIPNRFLRNSVNTFKNETGYSRPQQQVAQQPKPIQKPPPPKEEVQNPPPVQEQRPQTPEPEKLPSESEIMKAPEQKPEDKAEGKEEKKDKEKDPSGEKKKESVPGHISSHDESDYEDNITVTVPPAHMQTHGPPRTYNGNSNRKSREGYYHNRDQDSNVEDERENSDATPSEGGHIESHQLHQSEGSRSQPIQGYYPPREPMMHHQRQQGGPPMYPPHSNQSGPSGGPQNSGRPYMDNSHHQRIPQFSGGPPQGGYPPYYRQPYMPRPQGYMGPMGPGGPPRQPAPQNNLAAVYQNVQQKVGTGIIEDPLEAFNRLMQDREARKEHQSRGHGDNRHDRHRFSRSPERYRGKFGGPPGRQWPKSSPPGIRGRHGSPPGRHRYGERPREERDRGERVDRVDRERERDRERGKERRRRSSSGSERNSRSPARINPKSAAPRRRSWSRSPSFRNRSRSRSVVREHEMRLQQQYPQHSPRRSLSPRYRQEERPRYRSRGRAESPSRVRGRRRSRERFSPTAARNASPPPRPPKGSRYPMERVPSQRRGDEGYEFQNMQVDPRAGPGRYSSRDRENRPPKEFQQPPQNRYDNFDIEGPVGNEPPPPGFESNSYDPYGHPMMEMFHKDLNRSGYTPEPKDGESKREVKKSKHISRSESTEKSAKSSKKHKDVETSDKKKSSSKHGKSKDKESKAKKELDISAEIVKTKKVKDKKKKKKDDKEKKKLKKEKKHKKSKANDSSSDNENKDEHDHELPAEFDKVKEDSKSPPHPEPQPIQEEPENIPTSTTEAIEPMDLYDDLCTDHDIKFDDSREQEREDEKVMSTEEQQNQIVQEPPKIDEFIPPREKDSSPHVFGKHNDSVLDIYDFGENFDDLNTSITKVDDADNEPKPPASKWDEEEGEIVGGDGSDEEIKDNGSNQPITNEVLRRAENAIFTRAINAIRPLDKKVVGRERSPPTPTQKVHITIPVNMSSIERSVEIKNDLPSHPKGSIKDRLGVKVPDSTSSHRSISRTRSPIREKEKERERSRHRDKDRKRHSNEREKGKVEIRDSRGSKGEDMSRREAEPRSDLSKERAGRDNLSKERRDLSKDRGDFSKDRGDLVRDKGELSKDRGDLSRGDLLRERGDLSRDRGNLSRDRGDLSKDRGDLSKDRGDLSRDRGDLSKDRGDLSRDRGDLSKDKGDLSRDRGNLSRDRGDLTRDRGDLSKDRGNLSRDRGDLSRDRGDLARDRGDKSRDVSSRDKVREEAQRRPKDDKSRRDRSEERLRKEREGRSKNDREREGNTRKRYSSPDASLKQIDKRSRHEEDPRERQRDRDRDVKHSRDRDHTTDRLNKEERGRDSDRDREKGREKEVHKRKLTEENKSDSSSDSSSSSSDSDSNSDDEKSKRKKKHKKKEKKKKSSKSKRKKEKKSKSRK
ncbi:RBBP6 family protein [Megaselia abdita]